MTEGGKSDAVTSDQADSPHGTTHYAGQLPEARVGMTL